MVTIKEITKECSVSATTVSDIFNRLPDVVAEMSGSLIERESVRRIAP